MDKTTQADNKRVWHKATIDRTERRTRDFNLVEDINIPLLVRERELVDRKPAKI